jgi:hypothetical protein
MRSKQLKAEVLEGFASAGRGPCVTAEESIARARAAKARVAAERLAASDDPANDEPGADA